MSTGVHLKILHFNAVCCQPNAVFWLACCPVSFYKRLILLVNQAVAVTGLLFISCHTVKTFALFFMEVGVDAFVRSGCSFHLLSNDYSATCVCA